VIIDSAQRVTQCHVGSDAVVVDVILNGHHIRGEETHWLFQCQTRWASHRYC